MKIIVIILSLVVFFKTLYYGIYELKENNKIPGICIIILAFVVSIASTVVTFINC